MCILCHLDYQFSKRDSMVRETGITNYLRREYFCSQHALCNRLNTVKKTDPTHCHWPWCIGIRLELMCHEIHEHASPTLDAKEKTLCRRTALSISNLSSRCESFSIHKTSNCNEPLNFSFYVCRRPVQFWHFSCCFFFILVFFRSFFPSFFVFYSFSVIIKTRRHV